MPENPLKIRRRNVLLIDDLIRPLLRLRIYIHPNQADNQNRNDESICFTEFHFTPNSSLLTLNSSLFTPSPHININLQPSHLHVHAPTRQIRLECYLRLSEKIIRIHLRHRVMRRVWRNYPAVGTPLGFIGNPYSYLPVGHPLRLYGDLIYLFQPPRVANIQQRRRNTPLDLFTKNAFVMVERHHPVKRAQQQSSINIINRKRGIILRLPLVPLVSLRVINQDQSTQYQQQLSISFIPAEKTLPVHRILVSLLH